MWQTVGLETRVFGSVAILGLTGEFSEVWQIKELRDKGQGTGVRPEKKSRDGGEHGNRIARRYQIGRCFAVNSKNWELNGCGGVVNGFSRTRRSEEWRTPFAKNKIAKGRPHG